MARAKAQEEPRYLHEISAIVILLGLGLLLFLALVSFDPADVPWLNSHPNDPKVNFIGPVGAYVSASFVFLIGMAAFLIPFIMFVGAVMLMFAHRVNYWYKLLWLSLLILSGASLIQLAGPISTTFSVGSIGNTWPGGFLGHILNDKCLVPAMGRAGSGIIMTIVYLSSLVLLFEIRPVELGQWAWSKAKKWREDREKAKLEAADPLERIAYEQKKLAKKEKMLRKKLEKEGLVLSEKDEEKIQPKEVVIPEPKVIDTTIEDLTTEETGDSMVPNESASRTALETRTRASKKKKQEKDLSEELQTRSALVSYAGYELPSLELLTPRDNVTRGKDPTADLERNRRLLVETLKQFSIEVTPGDITRGATITRYEVYPAAGVRVERISGLAKNLARALKAEKINVLAPIPGKDTVGIEVGNTNKTIIVLRELLESERWRSNKARIPIAFGKDVYGSVLVADLADMPHLLIAGSTGSGKSVCINCILMSLVYRFSPEELRIILVDPKVVELQVYNVLPHLVVPVVTDPKKVLLALRWVINEMEQRYRIMAKAGVRNITAYNKAMAKKSAEKSAEEDVQGIEDPREDMGNSSEDLPGMKKAPDDSDMPEHLPYIVVIVDELADLMQTTPADVELAIARLSAKARAAGIHLIIATQTPRREVITGVIKTNIPCRVAFQVPSSLDSRVILDENGAENLLGKGDFLYLPPGSSKLVRAQGAFISDQEVSEVVSFVGRDTEPSYEQEIHEKLSRSVDDEEELSEKDEELIAKCLEVIRQEKRASTSLLQRRLRIGYARASWVVDQLEMRGIVGPKDGAKDREILVDLDSEELG